MIRKKTKPVDQYAFLTISLNTFSSAVNMSVNGQARDRRQDNDNVSLYSFGCDVEIQGTCTYLNMKFSNDSWTCWAYWPEQATRKRFDMTALSNNHLLVDEVTAKKALLSAETGDYIHLKGMLVSYLNPGNGFSRSTSTVRTDTGNGACETVYLSEFEVINKANAGMRSFYQLAKWFTILAMIGYVVAFFNAPVHQRYR